MKFEPLPLKGAYEIHLERREDDRGFFARMYCDDEFAAQGLNTTWVQMNVSLSREAGTLRGMHFQREPAAEIKLVRCLRGEAFDVIVDLRAGSDTYGQHCHVLLDQDALNAIYVPKGFAHGFQTLSDDTELQYCHSTAYAPGHEGGVNPLDPDLGIAWRRPVTVLSDRDQNLPPLAECTAL
ncbi:dTDP-4-dehydrorhamnose 3,5-epimerase [Falsiruegeria mediterranea]|uniref:dTDP-4-dehydrorhamnose 3,5-epimerase n=1 Tax=Falsiruegeria mediterranea M17 TaxID=1200281 RepID=A0A2R8CBI2_9RHOB|nr:dTDP-4-dehydrorhamnose 3,5-epimerase [Falsiruegeria mediterranea]SPJ29773.1 dTDP-4-dehydrorhamnose 3-epimerase [Falsiruegeria mediterranea M17]